MITNIEIGQVITSRKGFDFKVIEKLKGGKWKVVFIDTGYQTVADSKEVKNGGIRDWLAPYVCGKGVVGKEIEHPQSHYLYDRWRDMLRRCYDKKHSSYKTYGAIGCTVVDEWLYFPNYVRDIESKSNSEKLKVKNSGWEIDKDTVVKGNKVYSNETTCIITATDNIKERNARIGNPAELNKKSVMQFDIKGNYIKTFESIKEANEETSITGSHSTSWIVECCKGKAKTANGFCWMYKDDFINFDESKEKILKRVNKIHKGSNCKPIVVLNDNGEIIDEYESARELAKILNIGDASISTAISRKTKCKGLIVRHKEDLNI